jgi:hypothetical protein
MANVFFIPHVTLPAPAGYVTVTNGNPVYFTGDGAGITFERRHPVFDITDFKTLESAGFPACFHVFPGQTGGADSPHDLVVGRDDYIYAEFFLQRFDYTLIKSHASLEKYGWLDIFPGGDIAEIVAYQRTAKSVDDIPGRMPRLLFVNHVGLGENGTAPGDIYRRFALQSFPG